MLILLHLRGGTRVASVEGGGGILMDTRETWKVVVDPSGEPILWIFEDGEYIAGFTPYDGNWSGVLDVLTNYEYR
jgi:hypothetical protein